MSFFTQTTWFMLLAGSGSLSVYSASLWDTLNILSTSSSCCWATLLLYSLSWQARKGQELPPVGPYHLTILNPAPDWHLADNGHQWSVAMTFFSDGIEWKQWRYYAAACHMMWWCSQMHQHHTSVQNCIIRTNQKCLVWICCIRVVLLACCWHWRHVRLGWMLHIFTGGALSVCLFTRAKSSGSIPKRALDS
jgi:hypothetical protein